MLTAPLLAQWEAPVPAPRSWILSHEADATASVPAPLVAPAGERTATFIVNYDGFSPEAQVAFQYAVDIWSTVISSDVPIVIDATWTDLPGNALGSAGPSGLFWNFDGALLPDVLYPSPLADKLAGADQMPGQSDINANFDSGTNWYMGLDGNTPSSQYDLVSVVLHEIGHGLGFTGTMYVGVDLNGYVLNGSLSGIYDQFVQTGDGVDLLDLGDGTPELGSALVGDDLFWTGTQGNANSDGGAPKLYAPAGWQQGSSLSHFDEATYPAGNPHALMTPSIGNGESVHSPGAMCLGVLEDMGWTVDYAALDVGVGLPGCADVEACNYDPNATYPDASCVYPVADEPCAECTSTWSMAALMNAGDTATFTFAGVGHVGVVDIHFEWTLLGSGDDSWMSEFSFLLCDPDGQCAEVPASVLEFESLVPIAGGFVITQSAEVNLSALGLGGVGTWTVSLIHGADEDGIDLNDVTWTLPYLCPLDGLQPGCTDNAACNFDSTADYNDGSCDYFCFTCIETLLNETFQSYDTIQPLTVQSDAGWVTWDGVPGSGVDPFVVFDGADGAVAIAPAQTVLVQNADLLFPIGLDEGEAVVQFAVEIEPGHAAYYNIQGDTLPGVEWTLDVFIDSDGSMVFETATESVSATGFPIGTSTFLTHLFDLDANELRILLGSNLVAELTYTGALGGVNFYANTFGLGVGSYLLDDVTVCVSSTEAAGCTDPSACNYDSGAMVDDGSCWTPEDYGWCDCDGLVLDAVGECGGGCATDEDGDGLCDDVDPCLAPDLTPEILPVVPSTYIAEVTLDGLPVVGMTVLAVVEGVTVGVDEAFEFDGGSWVSMSLYVATGDEVSFLLFDEETCTTYDDGLTLAVEQSGGELTTFTDPGSLPFTGAVIPGCTDEQACNFDATATIEDGSCGYPEEDYLDCAGNCLNDADGDGICDEVQPQEGCTDPAGCDFDPLAVEPTPCTYPVDLYGVDYVDCAGVCLNDADGDGICDEAEVPGCMDVEACNFNPMATVEDGSCGYPEEDYLDCAGNCLNDADGDGICDEVQPQEGCTDPAGCDFDPLAVEPTPCTYPVDLYGVDYVDCAGVCLNDADGDGICDEAEVPGCMDVEACNFDPQATDDVQGACEYPWDLYGVDYVDCAGECLNDADGDGICDEAELEGCTDVEACNFWEEATEDDGTCAYLYIGDIIGPEEGFFGDTVTYAADNVDAPSDLDWMVEGGDIIAGLGTVVITVVWDEGTEPGTGTVTLIETNEFCTGEPLTIEANLVVGLEENAAPNWRLYPNPARDGFWVGRTSGPVVLVDLGGALVRSWNAQQTDGWCSLGGVAPGCYLLRTHAGGQTRIERLVVMP